MGLLRKRGGESIDRRQSLAGVPVLHEGVKITEDSNGVFTLYLELGRGPSFYDLFRPAIAKKKYELDEFGTFVVKQIQRKRTVLDIIRAFEQRFRLSHREAELGVVAFIKMLMKRHVLSVMVQ